MPALVQVVKRSTKAGTTELSPSCDDAKPFHFAIEPDAVNDERDRNNKRADCAGQINRRAFHEIDPDAPCSDPERKQRRENNENNMEALKRHLMKDRVVVPRQKDKPEKSEHKKAGENQDAVDEALFRGKMHEDCRYKARLKRCYEDGYGDIRFERANSDIRKCDCNGRQRVQQRTQHQVTPDVLLHIVRVFLVLLRILRNVRRIVHSSK